MKSKDNDNKEKEETPLDPRKQWAKFIIVTLLYLLFLYWVGCWWGLIVVPFIYQRRCPIQSVVYSRYTYGCRWYGG